MPVRICRDGPDCTGRTFQVSQLLEFTMEWSSLWLGKWLRARLSALVSVEGEEESGWVNEIDCEWMSEILTEIVSDCAKKATWWVTFCQRIGSIIFIVLYILIVCLFFYVFLLLCTLCSVYSVFRAFSSVVRQMPGYSSQRRGRARPLPD